MAQRDAWLDIAPTDLDETERQVLLLAARLMDRLAAAPAVLPARATDPR